MELCQDYGISKATLHNWRKMCACMEATHIKELKALQEESRRLKQMYAELMLLKNKPVSKKGKKRKRACCKVIVIKNGNLMKPIIAYILVFTLLATFLNSCGDGKFDYEKWSKVENTNYPPKARKNMIADVLQNEIRKGMNTSDVLKLLGGPDYSNDSLIIYNIEIEYSSGVDPELTRDLVIHFKSDSIVTSFELREIKD